MINMDRRNFLKGVALAGGAAALTGLVGCSPAASKSDSGAASAGDAGASGSAVSKSWRDKPEPIEDIAETVECDVVVVGAGAAGTCAVLASVEAGAKTVCIQKSPMVMTHGQVYSGFGTRWMKEAGVDLNIDDVVGSHVRANGCKPDHMFIRHLMEESAKTLEWMADETGEEVSLVPSGSSDPYVYDTPAYTTGHAFAGKAIGVSQKLADVAQEKGAEFYFETSGVQLVMDGDDVKGVIGKRTDGTYMQVNAAKGVILATGDYASNYEMAREMCPGVVDTFNFYSPADNTGEGLQMGLWAGGMIERGSHSKMCHPHNGNDGTELTDSPIKSDAYLWVNQRGERFCNEDQEYGLICNQVLKQPGQVFYIVMDDDFASQRSEMRNPRPAPKDADIDKAKELGYWKDADSIEELAKAFDIDATALAATVERYNGWVDSGADDDYAKNPKCLKPIKKAPFHIVRTYTPSDVALGGLMVNADMQVVREDGSAIKGLYAVGNCQGGGFGADDYTFAINGFSLGRAAISGRLAGENAAK